MWVIDASQPMRWSGRREETNRQHKEAQWWKTGFLGLTEKSPFLVQALFHLSSQMKHWLMHFCKLPRLTLGPADRCLLGCFYQALSVDRGEEHGTQESWQVLAKGLEEVAERAPALRAVMAFQSVGRGSRQTAQAFLLPNCKSCINNHRDG